MSKTQIYPAILVGNIQLAQQQLDLVASQSDLLVVQFDVIDGIFADNHTITPADMAELNFHNLQIDIHLMTDEPLDFVYECIEYREQLPIRSIIGQIERMSYQADFLADVLAQGWQVGLSLDIFTPVSEIAKSSWQHLDFLQLMGVQAGEQGQTLKNQVWEQIESATTIISELEEQQLQLIVDGGVQPEHVSKMSEAGVDGVVVGSGLWQAPDLAAALATYQQGE